MRNAPSGSRRAVAMSVGLGVVLAALSALPAPSAAAQEDADERARMLFQAGTVYYQSGEYERALEQFEAAFQLSPRPVLLYNIGLARERSGDMEGALTAFREFLASGAQAPDVPRVSIERRVAALESRIQRLRAQEGGSETPEVATPEQAAQQAQPAVQTGPGVTPTGSSDGGGDDGVVIGVTLGAVGAVLVAAAIVLAVVLSQGPEPYTGTLFSRRIP